MLRHHQVRLLTASLLSLILFLMPQFTSAEPRGISLNMTSDKGVKQNVALYQGSYALLIGVSDYTAGWPDLESIPSELKEVAAKLEQQGFIVITVKNPSSSELSRSIEEFIDLYGFDTHNRLLMFFSGHGYSRDNGSKGYLVPSDAPDPREDEKGFLRKAINMSQILSWARQIEAKHALFLFDSCFSGTVFKSKALPAYPPIISEATTKPVRQFISAGSAGEEVPAKSIFVPALLRALDGDGDINNDGYMTGSELGMYLHSKVLDYKVFQTPQYGKIRDPELDEGDFVFINPAYKNPEEVKEVKPAEPAITAAEKKRQEADHFWAQIKDSDSPAMLELFVESYPESSMAAIARIKVIELKKTALLKKQREQREEENLFWESIKDADSAAGFKAYLEEFPDGAFTKVAQLKIEQLEKIQLTQEQREQQQTLARQQAETAQKEEEETVFWNSVRSTGSATLYQAYLDKYPQGRFIELAQMMKIEALKPKSRLTEQTVVKSKLRIAVLPFTSPRGKFQSELERKLREGVNKLVKHTNDRFEIVATSQLLNGPGTLPDAYQISDSDKKRIWKQDGFFSRAKLDIDETIELCKKTGSDVAIAYSATLIKEYNNIAQYELVVYLVDPLSKLTTQRSASFFLKAQSWQNIASLTQEILESHDVN